MSLELNEEIPIRKIRNWLDLRPQFDGLIPSLLGALLILGITLLTWRSPHWHDHLVLDGRAFEINQTYRFFTSAFLHADMKHLLSNLLIGLIFYYLLSTYYGSRLMGTISLISSGLINWISYSSFYIIHSSRFSTPENIQLIGFSGVVYFFGALWLTLYLLTMTRLKLSHRILKFIGVSLLIFFPTESFDPTISYRTHFLGFIWGLILAIILFRIYRKKWQIELEI
jgi:rhomboid protease GluP